MSFTPAKVKTFTSVTQKTQNEDGTSTLSRPEVSLDDTINNWVEENKVVILSTTLDAFSVLESGDKSLIRRTVTTSQVVYMYEDGYYAREAKIRASALPQTAKPCTCPADTEKPAAPMAPATEATMQAADDDEFTL